jgi:steroid delta-isomerase-like uncharacterized protein
MDNATVLDRINQEAFNRGDVRVLDELLAEGFVDHDPMPGTTPDREGVKTLVRTLHDAFPDMRMEVDERIMTGDKAVERWSSTGTHEGEFMGIPATHRRVSTRGIDILRLQDGRVVEHWGQIDMLSVLQQLGAMPAEARA